MIDGLGDKISLATDDELRKLKMLLCNEVRYRKTIRTKSDTVIDELKHPFLRSGKYIHWIDARKSYRENIKWLKSLLRQDWNYLFSGGNYSEERKFCVYAHVEPKTIEPSLAARLDLFGVPFYIGKGTSARAYDLNRNQGHGKVIVKFIKAGYTEKQIVNIIKSGLTEVEALALESKLIYFFGTKYELNRRGKGILYNLETGRRPKPSDILSGVKDKDTVIIRPGLISDLSERDKEAAA